MKKGKILGRYERKLRVFPKITLQTSKACLTRQRTVQINGALDPYGRLWSSRWAVFIATLPMFLVKLWPKPLKNTFKDTVTFLGGSATRKNKQQPEDRKGDTLNSCKKQTTYRDPSKSLRPQFGGFLTEPKAALACFKSQLLSTPSNGRLALGGGNFCGPQRFWPHIIPYPYIKLDQFAMGKCYERTHI